MNPDQIMGAVNSGYEAEVLKALRALAGEVNTLSRQVTELKVTVYGMRRKLGFEDSWAEQQHDQHYIDALTDELRLKKVSGQ